ncbi:type II toxin-antitoxin system VapC family toxin [Pyrodictium delaneyi]|nr:type II toxin-antitoxin system VapC family toxin [Pyrodictium delaneyi]
MICLGTNILYNYMFKTELTEKARNILKSYAHEDFAITTTVLNEFIYIALAKVTGKRGHTLRRYVKARGYPDEIMDKIITAFEQLEIAVLPDVTDPKLVLETARSYRLLPADAMIALTCRHHRIDVIATFDEDFKRVPWLKVVP